MRWLLLALMLTQAHGSWAQAVSSGIFGEVTDRAGARLAQVSIKLVNLETGSENQTETDETGSFLAPGVFPGRYSLQVAREGFRTIHVSGLTLNVGEIRQLRIQLEVGSVEQWVSVEGSSQHSNAQDAQVSVVVGSDLIRNLPLNGRSFQDLIAMTPGAVMVSPQTPHLSGFSVNGQPVDTNTYTIDGVSANYGLGSQDSEGISEPVAGQYASLTAIGTTHGLAPLDALQEFRVVPASVSAEYGGSSGGQFSLQTRQGGTSAHGTAFAYLRNGYFDAKGWGGLPYSSDNGYYHQQDIGGSLGMPLHLLLPAKWLETTQGFAAYEELHVEQRIGPLLTYYPTQALLAQAPAAVRAVLGTLPTDSTTTATAGLAANWESNSMPAMIRTLDVRLDSRVAGKFNAFVRYGDTPSQDDYARARTLTHLRNSNQSLTIGMDGPLTARTANEFRFNWARSGANTESNLPYGPDLAASLRSAVPSTQTRSELYVHVYGSGPAFARTDAVSSALRQVEVRDTATAQIAAHLLRFGFDLRNLHSNLTPRPWSVEADYLSISALLQNQADQLVVRQNQPANPVLKRLAFFAQDQWTSKKRFSWTAGVRWEIQPAPESSDGRNAYHAQGDLSRPDSLTLSARTTALWKTDWMALGPRVGAAWQPFSIAGQEFTVRAGGGLHFDAPSRLVMPVFSSLGFVQSLRQTSAALPVAPLSASTTLSESGPAWYFPQRLQTPRTVAWTASVEQALGRSQSISATYAGALSSNRLVPRRVLTSSANPALRELVVLPGGLTARYDALQLAWRGSTKGRVAWMSSWVWSHTLDMDSINPWAMATRGNAETDVRHNLQSAVSWTLPKYRGQNLLQNASSGWGIDGRLFVRSAYPVNLLGNLFFDPVTGERFNTGVDRIPGKPLYLNSATQPGGRRINGGPDAQDAAFVLPDVASQGNAPRNLVRGFLAWQLSFAVRRDVPLYRQLHLELRGELFNVTNSPNYGYVLPQLTEQYFGRSILSLNQSYGQTGVLYQPGGPRSVQWMFRLRW